MFLFTLLVEEELDDKTLSDRQLRKVVSWPRIPLTGETLSFSGNGYPVTEVDNRLDKDPISSEAIVVSTIWWTGDFETLAEEDGWMKTGF